MEEFLYYATPLVEKEILTQLPEEKSIPPVSFSPQHQKRMQQLFRAERRKVRCKAWRKYMSYIAMFILVLGIVTSVSVMSVDAWRLNVMNYIIDFNDNYVNIELKNAQENEFPVIFDEIEFYYLPAGFFVETYMNDEDDNISIQFKDENEPSIYLDFKIVQLPEKMILDKSYSIIEKIEVQGYEALLLKNKIDKNNINLLWYDDKRAYLILTNLDKKETIKIAQNLVLKK